ncbi:hypothetical protein FO519_007115 [Halicephalobus sp. NKZ332]|nr:hypothetical protein FO519_007115 [Halicephalobus sp. NKZ332]
MSSIPPERLQEGRERILKCLYELDLDVDQFVPIETLYRSYARLFGVRFDREECFKYFETRDRVLAIQRFFPRWIFYAIKFENNVVSRLILTRQKFIKVKEDSSDGESAVFSTPVREYSPVTVKKIPLTSVDRAYLLKIASRSKETETSYHFPVKNNIQCDLTERNSDLSDDPFKARKPNDAFYSTQKQYVPLNQLKTTSYGMTEDSFCSIVKETTDSVPNRSNYNQYRNSSIPDNGTRQARNSFCSSKDTFPPFLSYGTTRNTFQTNSSFSMNRNGNVTQRDGINGVSKSGFIPPARPALKPLIRRDPPKSLMELTGLPSGPTRGRTLTRSKSISSPRSGEGSPDSGIASPKPRTNHDHILDPYQLIMKENSPKKLASESSRDQDSRERVNKTSFLKRSNSIDDEKQVCALGSKENDEIFSDN